MIKIEMSFDDCHMFIGDYVEVVNCAHSPALGYIVIEHDPDGWTSVDAGVSVMDDFGSLIPVKDQASQRAHFRQQDRNSKWMA